MPHFLIRASANGPLNAPATRRTSGSTPSNQASVRPVRRKPAPSSSMERTTLSRKSLRTF
eukprot:4354935-Alexandrium_andersonii.AAC.1